MLRIAKSTPGVLDLSAVKDEHGIPVTLTGASHRDVPDHEGDNPVLQRIVELGWVTMSPVPVVTPDDDSPAGLVPAPDQSSLPAETGDDNAGVSDTSAGIVDGTQPSTSEIATPGQPPLPVETSNGVIDAQDPVSDASTDQSQDEAASDALAKPEGSAKPAGKSDSRRAGRRSQTG